MRKSSSDQRLDQLSAVPDRAMRKTGNSRFSVNVSNTPQMITPLAGSAVRRDSRIPRPLLSWQHNRNQSNVNSVKNLQVSGDRWTPCRSVAGFRPFNSAQRSSSASGRFSGNDGRSSGFGGRLSGLSALGGIGSRSRYDVLKDPRPISDKGYQCGCIQNLIQFLSVKNYPYVISTKILASPSAKEFFNIIQHIFCQMDASFKLRRLEDVPGYFKALGYPIMITRSSMHAVGTLHTWPNLLAALVWLVDLLKFNDGFTSDDVLNLIFRVENEDFNAIPDEQIRFVCCTKAYAAYLRGQDDYDEIDKELNTELAKKYLGPFRGLDVLRSENERLQHELERIDDDTEKLDKMREKNEMMMADEKRMQEYLVEAESVVNAMQSKQKDLDQGCAMLLRNKQGLEKDITDLKVLLQQQDFTPADVQRLREERKDRLRQEESLTKMLDAMDADIWKEEMEIAKLLEKKDAVLSECSRSAGALGICPDNNGLSFDMCSSHEDLVNYYGNTIKPALTAIKENGFHNAQLLERAKFEEGASIEVLREEVTDTEEEISRIEKQYKASGEEYECRKRLYQHEIEGLQAGKDQLEREVRELQTETQMNEQEVERGLHNSKAWLEDMRRSRKAKETRWVDFMTNVATMVIDHKESVEVKLKQMDASIAEMCVEEEDDGVRIDGMMEKLWL